jgi:hypothetical protein
MMEPPGANGSLSSLSKSLAFHEILLLQDRENKRSHQKPADLFGQHGAGRCQQQRRCFISLPSTCNVVENEQVTLLGQEPIAPGYHP